MTWPCDGLPWTPLPSLHKVHFAWGFPETLSRPDILQSEWSPHHPKGKITNGARIMLGGFLIAHTESDNNFNCIQLYFLLILEQNCYMLRQLWSLENRSLENNYCLRKLRLLLKFCMNRPLGKRRLNWGLAFWSLDFALWDPGQSLHFPLLWSEGRIWGKRFLRWLQNSLFKMSWETAWSNGKIWTFQSAGPGRESQLNNSMHCDVRQAGSLDLSWLWGLCQA